MSRSGPLIVILSLLVGQIHLLCDEEPVMLNFGWRRSLEIKRLHSHGIGEEVGK